MVVARDPDRMTSDDLDDNKWVSLTQVCFLTVPLCSLSWMSGWTGELLEQDFMKVIKT